MVHNLARLADLLRFACLRGTTISINTNWTYTYDDFNRVLTGVGSGTNNNGCNWVYDRYGNRWQQNAYAGSCFAPQYTFDNNNRIQDNGPCPNVGHYCYDAAGNLLSDLNHKYTYDAENRLITVDGGSGVGGTTYQYDADGHRTRANIGGQIREFLHDLAGRSVTVVDSSQNLIRAELWAGDRHLATYNGVAGAGGTTLFAHTDWLGTERLRTDPTGTPSGNWTSLPFGEGSSALNSSALHFTGQERDVESGLDYFKARYFGSALGRFMSPDPGNAGAGIGDPQSWNGYAYVSNSPITATDPYGLFENPKPCPAGSKGTCIDVVATADPVPLILLDIQQSVQTMHLVAGNKTNAANKGFTFGIRSPGQTFSNCMQQHAQDYSVAGTIDLIAGSNLKANPFAAFFAGNHVAPVFFGSGGEAAMTGMHALPTAATEGMGSTLAYGRYASNVALDLNKAGNAATSALGWNTNLAAKAALKGVEKGLNLGLSLEMRLGMDIGASLAEAAGCARHP